MHRQIQCFSYFYLRIATCINNTINAFNSFDPSSTNSVVQSKLLIINNIALLYNTYMHVYASFLHNLYIFCIVFAQREGDLRVAGRFSRQDPPFGRLEIFINNVWGTICINDFTMESANTACKQLGRTGAVIFNSVNNLK